MTIRVRQLSPTGDYVFGNGQLSFYANSAQAIGQIVQTSLLLWYGEWFLDQTVGMPWLETVIGKHGQALNGLTAQNIADSSIQAYILQITGVVDIASFSSSIDANARTYSVKCTIDTEYGTTAIQLANYVEF
jgi:hypothetical protein